MREIIKLSSGVVLKIALRFKKVLILLWIFFLLINSYVKAQTTIPDSTDVFGTWDIAGSPYMVQGEAIVPTDSTLTIEPGVEIRFKTGTDFNYDGGVDCGFMRVNGKLLAQGTASQMITFTRDGGSGNWGVIYFEEANDSSIISFANVQYANKLENIFPSGYYNDCFGAITFHKNSASVENSIICYNINDGVHIDDYDVDYQNNINGNLLHNNKNGISVWFASPLITNNTIVNNTEYAFYSRFWAAPFIRNTIAWNNGDFIYISTGGHTQINSFEYCFIQGLSFNLPGQVVGLGNNVFNTDPIFIDPVSFNFQLNHNSQCINAGTPDTTGLGLPDIDLEGNPRIIYNQIDIGAYEFNNSDYLYITSPVSNGYWKNNNTHSIGWSSSTASNLKIEYSIDKGLNWSTITSSTPNDGSFDWLVPGVESDSAMIKITDLVNPSIMDTVSFRIGTTTHITDLEAYLWPTGH
ncbi:MAG: right-handed parallel beta-helix repeat-containing protein [Bacteroidales bacterium]